jgi:hypothetical protein
MNNGSAAGSSEKSTGLSRGSAGGSASHRNPRSVLGMGEAASTQPLY